MHQTFKQHLSHSHENVQTGQVKIVAVKSEDQLADLLTKTLSEHLFIHFQDQLLHPSLTNAKSLGEGV